METLKTITLAKVGKESPTSADVISLSKCLTSRKASSGKKYSFSEDDDQESGEYEGI